MLDIPKEISLFVENHKYVDVSCRSNSKTYHFDNDMFLKIDNANELKKEYQMATIFHKLGIGPKVIKYVSKEKDYLLTEEVKGYDLRLMTNEPERLCIVLAESLKKLHSMNTTNIPVSSRYERYIKSINGTIDGGYYDTSFLLNNKSMSKEEAWNKMQKGKHLLKCDTFIHGDACLPNIMADTNNNALFIDTGLSGLGDRHIDIYWALWSLEYNLKTDKYNNLFKDTYGRDKIDEEMIDIIEAFEVFG